MKKDTCIDLPVLTGSVVPSNPLDELVREGARKLLQQALEVEVHEYLERHEFARDEAGRRLVVRHGQLPTREVLSGAGPLPVSQPRVRHRDGSAKYTSAILPPYMRRTPSLDALIPALYLKGVSSGEMQGALEAILGTEAPGLSPSNIVRLKTDWEREYDEWSKSELSGKQYAYWWADGVHFNVRLEGEAELNEKRSCILVLMGALEDGRKEIIAVVDGYRESKLSWQELLSDVKRRGLTQGPKLAIGDGALGFWAALREEYGEAATQRCWVHKTANVLNKMPKSVQPGAKRLLHAMYQAPTHNEALKAYNEFLHLYSVKYPRACDCLSKDQNQLFTFYAFPAEHWSHIRSTNVIESTFATVRHRTRLTKGCGTRKVTLVMVFKLAMEAQKGWRRINAPAILGKILTGVRFVDGEEVKNNTAEPIAA